jgi:serine/threonine protein kinase
VVRITTVCSNLRRATPVFKLLLLTIVNISVMSQGFAHCGICPSAILQRYDGTVCICDLFHCLEHKVDVTRAVPPRSRLGQLDYMPPEMIALEPAHEGNHSGIGQRWTAASNIGWPVDIWQVLSA